MMILKFRIILLKRLIIMWWQKKNEKLYLINATNGNVISELGEGSYGYGDKYGKFIFVTVFSGDDYQYYVYNNEGKKLVALRKKRRTFINLMMIAIIY